MVTEGFGWRAPACIFRLVYRVPWAPTRLEVLASQPLTNASDTDCSLGICSKIEVETRHVLSGKNINDLYADDGASAAAAEEGAEEDAAASSADEEEEAAPAP